MKEQMANMKFKCNALLRAEIRDGLSRAKAKGHFCEWTEDKGIFMSTFNIRCTATVAVAFKQTLEKMEYI